MIWSFIAFSRTLWEFGGPQTVPSATKDQSSFVTGSEAPLIILHWNSFPSAPVWVWEAWYAASISGLFRPFRQCNVPHSRFLNKNVVNGLRPKLLYYSRNQDYDDYTAGNLLHCALFEGVKLCFSTVASLCAFWIKFFETLIICFLRRPSPQHLALLVHGRTHAIDAVSSTIVTRYGIFYVQIPWALACVAVAIFGKVTFIAICWTAFETFG